MKLEITVGDQSQGRRGESLAMRFCQVICSAMAVVALFGGGTSGLSLFYYGFVPSSIIHMVAAALFLPLALPQLFLTAWELERSGKSATFWVVSSGMIIAMSGSCLIAIYMVLTTPM